MGPGHEWRSACRRNAGLLLALLCALVAALPLVGPGIVNTRAGGDSPFLLQRLHQMVGALRGGQFPVRWMPEAAYGLGYPFFNFYAALPYYVAAFLSLLGGGYTLALKLTQMLGTLAASAAMYGFIRRVTRDEATSVLAAIAYVFAPFHLVNLYVRGDSLSEYWAFVFYPLIFWALVDLYQRPRARGVAALSLSYASLVMTHNVSALIFAPLVALCALGMAIGKRKGRLRFLGLGLAAGILALLVSAWFWAPALLERDYVQLEEMATGYFHYSEHFRRADLIQESLAFDYAIDRQHTPFSMGLVQAVLAGAGMITCLYRWWRARRVDAQSACACVLLLISTWMITPLSGVAWENVPLLSMSQFPWRFLSVQAFGTAWVTGLLIRALPRRRSVAWTLGVLVIVSSLAGLRTERLYTSDAEVTPERLMLYESFSGNIGTTVRHEYLPRWVVPRPYTSSAYLSGDNAPRLVVLSGEIDEASVLGLDSVSQVWRIRVSSSDARVAFQTHYFPGWQAWLDGERTEIGAGEGTGWIGATIPQGVHELELRFGRTPVRSIGEILSALALVVVGALLGLPRLKRRVVKGMALGAGFLLVVILALQVGRVLPPAFEQDDDLTMDFDRAPYLHHNPDGVQFADGMRLAGYRFSSDEVQAGDSFYVTLRWSGEIDEPRYARVRLAGATQHLFGVDYAYAESVESLSGLETVHQLAVPIDAPRGVYVLSLMLQADDGQIQPIGQRGEPLGTVYLRPIRVLPSVGSEPGGPGLGDFGSVLTLAGAEVSQVVQGQLRVRLIWQCREILSQNYALSLRLQDGQGRVVASRDLAPFCGAYPTSAWRPGERIADHQILALPEGTAPGSSYSLGVILYDLPSLAPIGSATVPEVSVTMPTVRAVERVEHQYEADLALKKVKTSRSEVQAGEDVPIYVLWAATGRPTGRYGCRLGLLDAEGSVATLSGQLTITPEYPTSVWPQDALVAERYRLPTYPDTPAGVYKLAVELLDADSGVSLGVYLSPVEITVSR